MLRRESSERQRGRILRCAAGGDRASDRPCLLTRRQLLRLGVVGGAAALVPWERAIVAFAQPSTDQWAVALPIPPTLEPASSDATADYYEIEMRTAQLEILPGQQTEAWTYNGTFPGPTIRARRNRRTVVTQVNNLDVDTSVHLHGAHVSAESDGHPTDYVHPGASKVYTYPNSQLAATLWYHDHVMHETSRNVYMGLAAFYLVEDEAEDALGLPSGDHDIPLMIADRSFDDDGSFDFPDNHNTVVGDTILVNGAPWPYLEVGTRKYRFRILNASNSREYELALDNGQEFVQVGSDGGLLEAPFATSSIPLAPAERVEVVVDFTTLPVGTSVVLQNVRGSSFSGTDSVMRFDVVAQEDDASIVPEQLRTIVPLPQGEIERDITLSFDQDTGLWVINGQSFDEDRVDVQPQLDVPEVWAVTNSTGTAHPFHIHLSMFQVLDRDGVPPGPAEAGWKDTVNVLPDETVRFATVFTEYTGRFVYHCHNLAHEDHDMMAQMEVVAPRLAPAVERIGGEDRYETAALLSAATFEPGVPVAYVATGLDYPDALAGAAVAGREGGPVLLVTRGAVPAATAAELERCAPQRIVVLGGSRAVADVVLDALRRFAPVERIGGEDRYETAALLSAATFEPGVPVVYVATGLDHPDALAGGTAAARDGGPVLLVTRGSVPAATAAELERCAPGRIVVLGGTDVVADVVLDELRAFAPAVERVAGGDRYATAVQLAGTAEPEVAAVYVATGEDHPDALAAGAAAGADGAPVLLVRSTSLPDGVGEELRRLAPGRIVVVGGVGAIAAGVPDQLAAVFDDAG